MIENSGFQSWKFYDAKIKDKFIKISIVKMFKAVPFESALL